MHSDTGRNFFLRQAERLDDPANEAGLRFAPDEGKKIQSTAARMRLRFPRDQFRIAGAYADSVHDADTSRESWLPFLASVDTHPGVAASDVLEGGIFLFVQSSQGLARLDPIFPPRSRWHGKHRGSVGPGSAPSPGGGAGGSGTTLPGDLAGRSGSGSPRCTCWEWQPTRRERLMPRPSAASGNRWPRDPHARRTPTSNLGIAC